MIGPSGRERDELTRKDGVDEGKRLSGEHSLVKATDLSKVNAAFFAVNGWVSMLFFVCWAADILLVQKT